MATAKPPSVIVLIDMPNNEKMTAVITSDSGIAVSVMNVVRRFHRNKKQDDHDQNAAVAQRLEHVLDRQVDEFFLLVQLGKNPHVGRQRWLHFFNRLEHVVGHPPGIGMRLLVDREHDGGPAFKFAAPRCAQRRCCRRA